MGLELAIRGKNPLRWRLEPELVREDPSIGFNQWAEIMTSMVYNGVNYTLPNAAQEEIGQTFAGFARGAFKGSPVVFACISVRMHLFSEARFQFRRLSNGRPGDLFGNGDLDPLEHPSLNETTGDLLSRMLLHADLAGNWFGTNRYGGIKTLRPDWVTIIAGSPNSDATLWDPSVEVAGYAYQPGGPGSGEDPILFLPEEVAHFAPIPDPEARFRGMSWLTPVIREVMSDKALTDHKLSFSERGATPNMVVKFPIDDLSKFQPWIEKFREQHEGSSNAYKTLFLGAGMDATSVGSNLQEMDLKSVQGAGETRIAAASGVPAIVVGLSEGLQGSSLNAGNYSSARRRFADITMRPLWHKAADSLATLVKVPGGAQLWYDDRDIIALQEDAKDAAEIIRIQSQAISAFIINGYEPDTATVAVATGDLMKLKHTGLVSVQLQEPNSSTGGQLPTIDGSAPPKQLQTGPKQKQLPPGRSRVLESLGDESDWPSDIWQQLKSSIQEVAPRQLPPVPDDQRSEEIEHRAPPPVPAPPAPPPPVTVIFDPGAIDIHVDAHANGKSTRTVTFSDGRTATIEEEPADVD